MSLISVAKDYTYADFEEQKKKYSDKKEYSDVFHWLLSIGEVKSMELPTEVASDALLAALYYQKVRIVNVLTRRLKGESIVNRRFDDKDKIFRFHEYLPLHVAASQNYWIVAAQLLKAPGIDVNATDKEGNTALHVAAELGDDHRGRRKDTDAGNDVHCQLTKILLSAPGIEINKQNKKGETPLHIAARFAHLRTIKVLLAQDRIDTRIKDNGRKTALAIAEECVEDGQGLAVRMLLEAEEAQRPHSRE